MEVFDALPSRALKRADIDRLREHDSVDGFIELEPQTVHLNGGLHEAVALSERTVVDLAFEDGRWNQRVLARDADRQRHLEEALGQLDGD